MASQNPTPEGIFSLLDTDLYKLTMQSAVLKYFPTTEVTYSFTNRTADMKLNRGAYFWLQKQIDRLANVEVTEEEIKYLRNTCPYLSKEYLEYLSKFRLQPKEHVVTSFTTSSGLGSDDDLGEVKIETKGLWLDTILYEIPLLALTSEAYFKFCDRDWTYDEQVSKARDKGLRLLENGCVVSEFGCRRRRDYKTQGLVLQGLMEAQKEGDTRGLPGKISGTSNVHFAMRFGIPPIGTVAHEWFMGVAAVTDSYENANEVALSHWVGTFGKGVLAVALTDTFGTPAFLHDFKKRVSMPSGADQAGERYADIFTGTRQDSGNPLEFIKTMREFYDKEGITEKKTIVFSDSLNVDKCIEYKKAAEKAGFNPTFGVGTFFTNDFVRATREKSPPLNIVIKISSANGKPAIKISDNEGKNMGNSAVVADVKRRLGYEEHEWKGADERSRWTAETKA